MRSIRPLRPGDRPPAGGCLVPVRGRAHLAPRPALDGRRRLFRLRGDPRRGGPAVADRAPGPGRRHPQEPDRAGRATVRCARSACTAPRRSATCFATCPSARATSPTCRACSRACAARRSQIEGRASLHGRILTVAREEIVEGEARSARHRLSLASPDGIRSVILETVDGLAFADAELQRRDGPGPGAAGRERVGAGAQARDRARRRPGRASGPRLSGRDALVEGELAAGRRPERGAAAGLGDPRERQRPGLARRGGDPDRRQPAGAAAGPVREPLRGAAGGAGRRRVAQGAACPRPGGRGAGVCRRVDGHGHARPSACAARDRHGTGADRADAVPAAAAGDAGAGPDGDGADRRPHGADRARGPLPGGRRRPAPQRRLAGAQHHRRQPARRARHALRDATRRRAHLPRRRAVAAAGPGRRGAALPTAWTATSRWTCSGRAAGASTGRGSRTVSWSSPGSSSSSPRTR